MKKLLISIIAFWSVQLNSLSQTTFFNKKEDIEISHNWVFKGADSSNWLPASVPGCIHTDLMNNKIIEDPFYRQNETKVQWIDKKDWEYKTILTLNENTLEKENIELYFEGLDTYADVFINGINVLKTDNMFREWRIDIKKYINAGNNELRIYFHSPIKIGLVKLDSLGYGLPAINDQSENGGLGNKKVSVFTRKAGYHYGWDWGPRLVTSGIWRPVHLLSWNTAEIDNIQMIQTSIEKDTAKLKAVIEIYAAQNATSQIQLSLQNTNIKKSVEVTLSKGLNKIDISFDIPNPKLWWTNGLGNPYLYNIDCKLLSSNTILDQKSVNIGLRTLKIVQKTDSWGKSFYVELNGVPVFMKGANYIPNDNFLNRVDSNVYKKIINTAAASNMNMLRVWGGGIYENNEFYNLCDKNGILLWHDFMFACSMYPGDDEFIKNIEQEIIQNIKRLRNHPSIALWCGNNEIDAAWQQNSPNGGWGWKQQYNTKQKNTIWHSYDTLFHKIIPDLVNKYDEARFYWPSSPVADWYKHADFSANSGDIHYWDVWWGQKPFSDYRTHIGRFMSEYGFQSFPELKSVQMYAIPEDYDIFSEVMKAHQRSSIGNGTIKNYMQRDYKVPSSFKDFLYVGQVLQAEGIKLAIEAHRTKMPYCMGSLYWQINDCWPVASWSSTDYYGRWKALQYFAKKAFEPVLVSPILKNDTISIYIVSDLQKKQDAELQLKIIDFDGKVIYNKNIAVVIEANSSKLTYVETMKNITGLNSLNNILLLTQVLNEGKKISENTLYFKPVKELALDKNIIGKNISVEGNSIIVKLKSNKLAKNVFLNVKDTDGFFNDNYFDILPGNETTVTYSPNKQINIDEFKSKLEITQMAEIQ